MPTKEVKHVAIIMDGNGRWGINKYGKRTKGHIAGARRAEEIVRVAAKLGLKTLTLWGFSTENWNRPAHEVQTLLWLFNRFAQHKAQELHEHNVRVTFIGRWKQFPKVLVQKMSDLQSLTAENTGLHLQLALNYGGHADIVDAFNRLRKTDLNRDVTEADISAALSTAGTADPDLIIRTSGETRTSGFMPWEGCYSEWVFSDTLWPDFTRDAFTEAIKSYSTRERRFGGLVQESA